MTDGDIPPLKPGSVKTFNCPSCGGAVSLRAVGIAITAVCQSCGSIIDVANENLAVIQEAAVNVRKSKIPLGTRGVLFGTTWEVIGYTEYLDGDQWHEYLLFNPYQGFRFLVESGGHWNFVKMLREQIPGEGLAHELSLHGRHYRLYDRGTAVVQYVMGEFYWRVKVGDKSRTADYICPPYMLSMEESEQDVIWSLGIYVESDEIHRIFVPASTLSPPDGIAPNQPSIYAKKAKAISMPMALFLVALVLLQCLFAATAKNQVLYDRTVRIDAAYKGHVALADPIDIPGKSGNLKIVSYSPIYNNWVELSFSLVNDATQESDDFIQEIEYYYGHDSDGNWSEGGQATSSVLSAIPGGKYRLLVEPDAAAFRYTLPIHVSLLVIRDVPVWANFWVAVLMVLVYPLYLLCRKMSFETQRWAGSDYAPGKNKGHHV